MASARSFKANNSPDVIHCNFLRVCRVALVQVVFYQHAGVRWGVDCKYPGAITRILQGFDRANKPLQSSFMWLKDLDNDNVVFYPVP
jgi:hypothetical protein